MTIKKTHLNKPTNIAKNINARDLKFLFIKATCRCGGGIIMKSAVFIGKKAVVNIVQFNTAKA